MNDDPHLQDPLCPDCEKQLSNIISDRVLTSYPPYYCYSCDCGFSGYVMLDWSEEGKKFWEENKGLPWKFPENCVITNDQWIKNLKNSLSSDG